MRFTILSTDQKRICDISKGQEWHKKFAWKPIRMTDHPEVVIWLEFVLRKGKPIVYYPRIIWKWTYVESTFDVLKMDK